MNTGWEIWNNDSEPSAVCKTQLLLKFKANLTFELWRQSGFLAFKEIFFEGRLLGSMSL